MPDIGLQAYMLVAAAIFSVGLGVVVARRNAIAVLCGIELILNGAALYFVAINRFGGPETRMDGQMFAIFIIILAAAEAAVALGILLNLYQMTNTVQIDEADSMRN